MTPSRTLATATLALFLAGAAAAQTPPKKGAPNNDKQATQKAPATGDPIATGALADRLARYGDERKDPLLLIAAARLKLDLSEKQVEINHKAVGKGGGAAKEGTRSDMSAEALLSRARELAGGRADLIALVDDVAKSRQRGVQGGYKYAVKVVNGNSRHIYTEVFNRGETGAVAISGDGDSDLDLYIYDEAGNVICRSESSTDDELCRFTPYFTTPFRIVVTNRGFFPNRYVMRTN